MNNKIENKKKQQHRERNEQHDREQPEQQDQENELQSTTKSDSEKKIENEAPNLIQNQENLFQDEEGTQSKNNFKIEEVISSNRIKEDQKNVDEAQQQNASKKLNKKKIANQTNNILQQRRQTQLREYLGSLGTLTNEEEAYFGRCFFVETCHYCITFKVTEGFNLRTVINQFIIW